jgi:microcystin-dependent protein
MGLFHYLWSRTAASNATADSNVNWAEGMAPSAVNDSARAMMASAAGFRDDIAGAIATAGTSTAYTVSTYQVFDTLAHMNGQVIAFTPHTTNGATVTLNVDGLGAKPLRSAPSVELSAGTLVQGTPYTCLYNSSDAAFYLHNFFVNPYNIPLAGGMDYWGTTAPNSAFAFAYGQAISRSTYSSLFALVSTTFGVGDGSTTFNLPDKRGRASAGVDNMGGVSASRLTTATMTATTLGGVSAATETKTLLTANLPAYTPAGTITNGAISITPSGVLGGSISRSAGSAADFTVPSTTTVAIGATQGTTTFAGTAQGGTSTAFSIVQPTIACNYIIRIL